MVKEIDDYDEEEEDSGSLDFSEIATNKGATKLGNWRRRVWYGPEATRKPIRMMLRMMLITSMKTGDMAIAKLIR